jgi:hypothetical protein
MEVLVMVIKIGNRKLYPVCSWEQNQHKLYNAYDRIYLAYMEDEVDYDRLEEIEHLLSVFDSCVRNGIVYAEWEDAKLIKDYIGAYDLRH